MLFSIPADAIRAPSPNSFFREDIIPMKHKVRPDISDPFTPFKYFTANPEQPLFRPVNTIDDVNLYPSQQKTPETYGSKHRTRLRDGLNYAPNNQRVRPREPSPVHKQSASRISPPQKRQKMNHSEVVDLDAEDEVHEIKPPPQKPHSSPDYPASATSQRSLGSVGTVWAGSKRHQAPVSAFESTNQMVTPIRRKNDRNKYGSMIVKSRPHTPSNFVDDLIGNKSSPIQVLDEDELAGETTSRYFQSNFASVARINHSTSTQGGSKNMGGRPAKKRLTDNLRDNFKRSSRDAIEDDQDELHVMGEKTVRPARRSKSPGKNRQKANTATPQKITSWPLVWARSHGFVSDDRELTLVVCTPKTFKIVHKKKDTEAADDQIDISRIIEAESDGELHVRLKGSRQQDGNQPSYDLHFLYPNQLQEFCREYVRLAISPNKIHPRPE